MSALDIQNNEDLFNHFAKEVDNLREALRLIAKGESVIAQEDYLDIPAFLRRQVPKDEGYTVGESHDEGGKQESIEPLGPLSEDSIETMEIDTPDDPWRHRSAGMKCETCMWYVAKTGASVPLGRCRRRSPSMNGYPAVFPTDWCGDHKLDETKL